MTNNPVTLYSALQNLERACSHSLIAARDRSIAVAVVEARKALAAHRADSFDAENGPGAGAELLSLAAVNSGRCPCGDAFDANGACPSCGRPRGCEFPSCTCDPEDGCQA